MSIPNTIGKPTVTYNALLTVQQLNKLKKIAHDARKDGAKHISAASLIREAIDKYLEDNV